MSSKIEKIYKEATEQVVQESKVLDLLTEENILIFIQSENYNNLMTEVSRITSDGGRIVDDGPGFMFGNFKTYSKVGDDIAKRCGYTVLNYIMGDSGSSFNPKETSYPEGAGEYPVSWYPSGDTKEQPTDVDKTKWKTHLDSVIKSTGYAFINSFIKDKELNNK
jgi:hypothetical protein